MLTGLMDHWVPSHHEISRFWKTPFEELRPAMEALCDEVAIDNFTFYTKWATNGLKLSLPFLRNDPLAQNVLTDNAWGQQWLDFFHARGMTVGAMLQCYQLEGGALQGDAVLGPWRGSSYAGDRPADQDVLNPLWAGYPALLEDMLGEQLRLFPDLDAVFLEFEGINAPLARHPLRVLAEGSEVAPGISEQWEASGWPVDPAEQWIWTRSVQQVLGEKLRENLRHADRIMNAAGYTGIRGVVAHIMGYESPYVHECLPNNDWWILPWHYWGWNDQAYDAQAILSPRERQQIAWCKERLSQWKAQGYHLCYIGNATLPTAAFDVIAEMARHCLAIGADGYLGMGNPIPNQGLRWLGATEAFVAQSRQLYRQLFPSRRALVGGWGDGGGG